MAERMPLLFYFFLFSMGAVCHRFVNELIPVWFSFIFILVLLCLVRRCATAGIVLACCLGIFWANTAATVLIKKTIAEDLEKKDVVVVGDIVSIPIRYSKFTRFDFLIHALRFNGKPGQSPGKVRLKVYHQIENLGIGQRWEFTVRLKRPHSLHNPGSGFDYETYLFENRIRATGYVRDEKTNRRLPTGEPVVSVGRIRESVSQFIQSNFQSYPQRGVLIALLVGVRGYISHEDWAMLRNTGTIHLAAISGLHIGLVSGLVMLLAAIPWRFSGPLQRKVTITDFSVIFAVAAGIGYALLAGMTIPTRRAIIMLAVCAMFLLTRRKADVFEILILALAAVLLLDPLSPLSPGFWLSFSAVAIIIACVSRYKLGNERSKSGPVKAGAGRWLGIQFALSFGLAPILLVLFNQVPLVSPAANLIAVPVIGFLAVPLGLIGLVFYLFGLSGPAVFLFECALQVIELLWPVLNRLGSSELAVWKAVEYPIFILFGAGAGIVLLSAKKAFPVKSLGLICLWPVLVYRPSLPGPAEFSYTMLDVGHGLASLIQTQNHLLLFDTGPSYEGGIDTGRSVVLPYLQSIGAKSVDVAIVSHEHNDHAGGFGAVSEEIQIDRVLSGVPIKIPGAEKCRSGQSWRWDGVDFEILWPFEGETRKGFTNGNNGSCVLKVSSAKGSVLLTSDIESGAERELVNRYGKELAADVLQVPHQGSRSSSTSTFLNLVGPRLALVSTGYLNRFGHPHADVVNRYEARNIEMLDTAASGAVSVQFSDSVSIQRRRDKPRGYWYNKISDDFPYKR